jgi:two-component system, response regulator
MTVDVREILLVEDNMADARMTIMALEERKIANKIVHVKDGAEALDFIFARGQYESRKDKDLPVLILLDLKMPKVNGIEVLEAIKNDDRTRKIPVTVFTSSQEDPDVKRCYHLGVNSYVVKPLDFDSFNKVVQDIGLYWLVVNHLNG